MILIVMMIMEKTATTIAFLSICAIISWFVGLYIIEIYDSEPKPTALDVYRGKTTLEITYRDSVAIDSVVVYK